MAGRCVEGSKGDEVNRRRQKAVDWEEWATVIKEGKAVEGRRAKGT